MFDLKILQLEWLRAFWPITQEQHFSQIEDLYRNTVNNINFHYRTNSGEINDQIFLQIQKTCFRTIFPHFPSFWEGGGGKKSFPKKSGDKVFQYHAKIQRNLMIQFQEKKTNRQQDGRMNRLYFIGPYKGSNKYNCCRLAFNSQIYRRQYRTNQKLLPHSQHAKKQFIHKLILQITADFRVS